MPVEWLFLAKANVKKTTTTKNHYNVRVLKNMQVLQSQLKSTTRNSFPFSLDSLTSTSGLRIVTNNSLTQKKVFLVGRVFVWCWQLSDSLISTTTTTTTTKKLANAMFKKRSDLTTKTKILLFAATKWKVQNFWAAYFFFSVSLWCLYSYNRFSACCSNLCQVLEDIDFGV